MDAAIPIMSPDAAQPLSKGKAPAKGEGEFAEVFAGEYRKQGEQDIPEEIMWQVCMPWAQSPIGEMASGADGQSAVAASGIDGAAAPVVQPQGQAQDIPADAQTGPMQAEGPLVETVQAEAEISVPGETPAGVQATAGPVSQAEAADGTFDTQPAAGAMASGPEQADTAQGQPAVETHHTPADKPLQDAAVGQTAYAQEAAAQPQAVSVTPRTTEAKTINDMAAPAVTGKQPKETASMPQTQAPAEAHAGAGKNAEPAVAITALKQADATGNQTVQTAPKSPDTPQGAALKEQEAEPVAAPQAADASLAVDGRQAPMEQTAAAHKTQTAPAQAAGNAQRVWEVIESNGLKDGERLTVKLKPEMLGGLTIEAVKTGRGTEVRIIADTVQGLRTLEQEMPSLEQHMQGTADFAGMQLSCRQGGDHAQQPVPFIRGTVPLMQMQEIPDMAGSTIDHTGLLNILA